MKFTLAGILLTTTLGTGAAWSQPHVTTLDGIVGDDQSVTITGIDFGVKSPAAPYRWDDFDHGELGTKVIGWQTAAPASKQPQYSIAKVRVPSHQSVFQDYTDGNYLCALLIYPLPVFQKMYITGWWYNEVGGAPSTNLKILNFTGGTGYEHVALPQTRTDMYPVNPSGHLYAATSANNVTHNYDLGGNPHSGEWMRLERYVDVGTPGQSNGTTWIKRNLLNWASLTNVPLYSVGDAYTMLLITHFFDTTGDPVPWMRSYWDELYIDITPARVELGNASTWDACTVREIQIPSAWDQSNITFTVNQGSLTLGQFAYVYVVNANEEHNTDGFRVTIGPAVDPGDLLNAPGLLPFWVD